MTDYPKLCMDKMREQGLEPYQVYDGDLQVDFVGSNMRRIPITLRFDREEEGVVHLQCKSLVSYFVFCGKDDTLKCIERANRENQRGKWVTFFAEGYTIHARSDGLVTPENCGQRCIDLAWRMARAIDLGYGTLGAGIPWA